MNVFWVILLASANLFLIHAADAALEKIHEPTKLDPEFQKLFRNFIDENGGALYFHKFNEESIKRKYGHGEASGSASDGNDKGNETDHEQPKKSQPPVAGKVFAFYGKSYGCQHSIVYKTFLIDYQTGETGFPKEMNATVSDAWLIEIVKLADKITTEGDVSVQTSDAEAKFNGLTPEQRIILDNGVSAMPLPAQLYIRFLKEFGCGKSNLGKYTMYKTSFKEAVSSTETKYPNATFSNDYWNSKGKVIVDEIKLVPN